MSAERFGDQPCISQASWARLSTRPTSPMLNSMRWFSPPLEPSGTEVSVSVIEWR